MTDLAAEHASQQTPRQRKPDPVVSAVSEVLTVLIAEHRAELAALTQRIGQQNVEINKLHAQLREASDLLVQAATQIIGLNDELNTATGDEHTTNVVALMIQEKLAARS